MSATETAATNDPATTDARPYLDKYMDDPEYRAMCAQAKAELDFVDGIMNAVLDRSRELGISSKDLAEQSCSPERSVRRLLAGHPEKADFCTVVAVAATLGIKMSFSDLAEQPVEQAVPAAS